MARMPEAIWVGEQSDRVLMDRYDGVCLHTIVGFAPAHAAHFSVAADGTIYQSRDTKYRSAANLNGNHRLITVENEDNGAVCGRWDTRDGHAVPGFTPEQIESNAKILRWSHEEHGVPLQLMPNSRASSRGLAYHRQGIDGNFLAEGYRFPGRVRGGEVWTKTRGKVCPGDRRIAQRIEILQLAQGKDWLDMATEAELEALIRRVVREEVGNNKVDVGREHVWSDDTAFGTLINRTGRIEAAVKKIQQQLNGDG